MIIKSTRIALAVFLPLSLALAACSNKDDSEPQSDLLKFIPADTPYVLVTQEKLPDDVYAKIEPHMDQLLSSYRRLIRATVDATREEIEAEGGDSESMDNADALVDELAALLSVDGLGAAGIDRNSRFAFFGHGLLPVTRLTLSDGSLLEAEFTRLETRAGKKLDTSSIGGHTYRYAGDEQWRIIIAIIEDQLVLTFAPAAANDEQLKTILGLNLPVNNIAASGELTAIAGKYDFEDFLIGFSDLQRVVATFTDEQTGINALLLEQAGYEPVDLSEVCLNEIDVMTGILPRVVTGYTHISERQLTSRMIFELREDIARGMTGLSGTVPGLGSVSGDLFSFGMSFDLLAIRQFYADRLDAMEANPLECELFADLQGAVADGRAALQQPVPPIAYGFKGFLAVIDDIQGMDIENGIPPSSIDMRFLVSTDNAEGLLAMGAMFSPEIAALNLESGGEPVRLDLPQIAAMGQTVYAALNDTALALSVGENMQDGLQEMLAADVTSPQPILSIDLDAAKYYDYIAASVAADANAELPEMPEFQAALQDLVSAPRDIFSRFRVDVQFTGNGVEFISTATLHD